MTPRIAAIAIALAACTDPQAGPCVDCEGDAALDTSDADDGPDVADGNDANDADGPSEDADAVPPPIGPAVFADDRCAVQCPPETESVYLLEPGRPPTDDRIGSVAITCDSGDVDCAFLVEPMEGSRLVVSYPLEPLGGDTLLVAAEIGVDLPPVTVGATFSDATDVQARAMFAVDMESSFGAQIGSDIVETTPPTLPDPVCMQLERRRDQLRVRWVHEIDQTVRDDAVAEPARVELSAISKGTGRAIVRELAILRCSR